MMRSQFTVFASMTVLSVAVVPGPVYGVRVVPAGTPVFDPSGKPVGTGVEEDAVGVGDELVEGALELDDGGRVDEGDAVTVFVTVFVAVTVFVGIADFGTVTVTVEEHDPS